MSWPLRESPVETSDGKQLIIGDADIVEVTDKSVFFATAGDDNS